MQTISKHRRPYSSTLSAWKRLIDRQITLEEALDLLVDSQGIVDIDLLDLEVNKRFCRQFSQTSRIPSTIPLLLWQNCYYLGSPVQLSQEEIWQIGKCTGTTIKVLPISAESYQKFSLSQAKDVDQVSSNHRSRISTQKLESNSNGSDFSVWKQLVDSQIRIDEALKLLIDPYGIVNFKRLDLEVSRQFLDRVSGSHVLPPVLPLLFWRNCYYLGSASDISIEETKRLAKLTETDISIIPISQKSYLEYSFIQEVDTTSLVLNRFIDLFKENETLGELSVLTEAYLRKAANPTEQLNILIAGAFHHRASDIHLEPEQQGLKIRYRIDGILQTIIQPQTGISPRLIVALKVKCDMDITEKRRPQDGRIRLTYESMKSEIGLLLDIRVSVIPCVYGEKAVVRLLPENNPFAQIDDLGFPSKPLVLYKHWLRQPQGLIIVTGPTGAGKTSTLYTSLQIAATDSVNVVTIEDPVEYVLPGITQSQVQQVTGMTFATGLRAILRQDPDIIMVGEIRDTETAETLVRAALTGHLVFTTLHTNDAISAIARLQVLGLNTALLSDALLGIVAQRLVRKICPRCVKPYRPSEQDLALLGLTEKQGSHGKWRCGEGCSYCAFSGYFGRQAIVELLNVNRTVKQLVREDKIIERQETLSEDSLYSFRTAAIEKVMQGVTTVAELQRVLPDSVLHS